ncbi:MAG: HAMP domain-containing sensor histidine kinase [Methylomicrobium sp.]
MTYRLPFLNSRLFRLRSILLFVMLMVLVLPLGGLYFFRIYENELVRQTEQELISQAAALSASYRQLLRNLDAEGESFGRLLTDSLGNLSYAGTHPISLGDSYAPIFPELSLFDQIKPPRPLAEPAPISSDNLARRAGVLVRPILQDTQMITLSGIRLLDPSGIVIAGREEVGSSLAHIPEVAEALQGRYASVIRQRVSDEPPPPLYSISRGANIRVFIAFPVIENARLQGVLYLSRTPNNILKHLYAVKGRVLLAGVSLLLIVVTIVAMVSSSIARPIRELIRQTEKLKSGEQKVIEPLQNPVTVEIAQLSESFAGMSHALSERTDYIRRFATHVSHEFKTPLTSIHGALELLQDHSDSMSEERRQRFLANLLADTHRLKQLVNRLLELAHADAMLPSRQKCRLQEVAEPLKNRYAERGLHIELDTSSAQSLSIAPEVLEMVLVNLLENSLQHGADRMRIHSERLEGCLQIGLQDNGAGISRENRNKIFTPFFTTRRNAGGTGLGLEIVASLMKTYGGEIELGECSQGALFWLRLPVE